MVGALMRRSGAPILLVVAVAVLGFWNRHLAVARDEALVRIGRLQANADELRTTLAAARGQAVRNEAALADQLAAERLRVRRLTELHDRIARHEDRAISPLLRETMQ